MDVSDKPIVKGGVVADEGFFFGLGAFETIAVEQGKPVFLEAHLDRMMKTLDFLGIGRSGLTLEETVWSALDTDEARFERKALRLTVTERNILTTLRENRYRPCDYERGFTCNISRVRRNETSALTYHKTLNYGDCLLEKRAARKRGIDEPLFLNIRGSLCEGATTNIFLVRQGTIYTPYVQAGLLPGIMRAFICAVSKVYERELTIDDTERCDEMFLTNSLLGVMPVRRLCDHEFTSTAVAEELQARYRDACKGGDGIHSVPFPGKR